MQDTSSGNGTYKGMPLPLNPNITDTVEFFQALDNFTRTFAFRRGDEVLMLADPLLDRRVIDAIRGHAKAKGASFRVYMETNSRVERIEDHVKPLLDRATFVVSSWFCSVFDPYCLARRREGQRWVKITYFRDLDLLKTPQARFPIEIVGELTRATARRFPKGEFDLRFSDKRGTDLTIQFTEALSAKMFTSNRWRGKMTAEEDGCYVHYLASHGPNFWDNTINMPAKIDGVLYPQWAVGFPRPFDETIAVHFRDGVVTQVDGVSSDANILRDMLVGGSLIEGGGCGFNPKAPRHTAYPAGVNAPGALHFGIDLLKPADYIRKHMPDWEEPPVHVDLINLDCTVTAGANTLIEEGFLCALRDPEVVQLAASYGDPVELLEAEVL